jgi:hypothetical protein
MPTEQLHALAWALPTVLVLAGLIVLLAKKLLPVLGYQERTLQPMSSTTHVLSDATRAHLLQVEGKCFLIVESDRPTSVQVLDAPRDQSAPALLFRRRQ